MSDDTIRKLFCLAGNSTTPFEVTVSIDLNIFSLKTFIRETGGNTFLNVDAEDVVLWKLNEPELIKPPKTLAERIRSQGDLSRFAVELDDPSETVLDVFPEQPPSGHLHIIIPQFTLNCLVLGDDANRVFPVKMAPKRTVHALKKTIVDEKGSQFAHVLADAVVLWKVSVPVDHHLKENLNKLKFIDEKSLLSVDELSEVFLNLPAPKDLHIVVRVPPAVAQPLEPQLPSTSQPQGDLGELRRTFLRRFPNKSPSTLGQPSEVRILQTSTAHKGFCCNRPPSAAATIPLTLLHPVFNEFKEDCETHRPTMEDNKLALELSDAMSEFFVNEKARQTRFIEVLARHGLHITPAEIVGTSYCTDGDMRCNGFPYFIGELKHEMGSKGAEPVFQSALYYTSHLRQQKRLNPHSPLPCLVCYLIGATLGFVGLGFTDRTNIQVLEQPIRLDYHHTDVKLQTMAARYFGALRKATDKLKRYYEYELPKLEALSPVITSDPRLPCYSVYHDLTDSSVEHTITYSSQPMRHKLIFFGESEGTRVCIKFVTRYSKDAHVYCVSIEIAPKLRGFEALPGGWFMVVMDRIDDMFLPSYTLESSLTADLRGAVTEGIFNLHQAGFVHGDLRDTNLMVRKDGQPGFLLVDFDWAGEIGEVRYPMNVNRNPALGRPAGVYDGELITTDHDLHMLETIFKELID